MIWLEKSFNVHKWIKKYQSKFQNHMLFVKRSSYLDLQFSKRTQIWLTTIAIREEKTAVVWPKKLKMITWRQKMVNYPEQQFHQRKDHLNSLHNVPVVDIRPCHTYWHSFANLYFGLTDLIARFKKTIYIIYCIYLCIYQVFIIWTLKKKIQCT